MLKTLEDIYIKGGEDFLKKLFSEEIQIVEKLSGTYFAIKRKNNKFEYFKNGNKPISLIDRTVFKLYEYPIKYFESISEEKIKEIPEECILSFQYFFSINPNNITYDKLPKNNLVLIGINGKKVKINDLTSENINKLCDYLGVGKPPLIYKGKLNNEQIEEILNFLKYKDEFLQKYDNITFTKYFLSIINKNLEKTILHDDLTKPIENIIFKFNNGKISAKLVDSLFSFNKEIKSNNKEQDEIITFIIFNIIDFLSKDERLNLYEIKGESFDECYIDLMCKVFNDYIEKNYNKFDDLEIKVPKFAMHDIFNLNLDNIKNEKTLKIINVDTNLQNILRIILSSFKKYRKNEIENMDNINIKLINNFIDVIKNKIQLKLDNSNLDFFNFNFFQ